ncbi:MAG TPA: hypothetical protein VFQ53_21050 [Kofleriaceae bacterium]|nr:hypothetical protein [Kofleriaceae bacterium]
MASRAVWWLLAGFVLLAVSAPAPAHAEPGFVWDAPAGCPDAAAVRARIERRLPGDVRVLGIEVSITRDGDGFVAQVDTRALTVANGTRTLRSARCDQLADAVAVIVARLATEARRQRVATAPLDTGDGDTDAGQVGDADEPAAFVHHRRPATPVDTAERPRVWGGGVRALAVSGIGLVPHVGLGGELAGFVRRHNAFGELAVARWAERPMYLTAGAPGRVDVGITLLAARGGWASDHMPLRGWLGVESGLMHGTGIDLYASQGGSTRWTAVAAGFGVGWPMSEHARLVGTFELAAPVERARFELADGTMVYEPSGASARCALGLELGWK